MLDLTEEQRRAVDGGDNRFVVACPGSGKTRVALAKTLRAAIKVRDTGARVLAMTFANSAKDELTKRVDVIAGPVLRKTIEVSTLHAFVLQKIIRRFGAIAADGKELHLALAGGTIYEEAFDEVVEKYRLGPDAFAKLLKSSRRAADGSVRRGLGGVTQRDAATVVAFWDALLSRGYVDYSNALYIALRVINEHEWIRDGLSAQYPIVVVDEYQDINDTQLELLRLLHAGGSTLFLVGDLFQCVYGFTGADPAMLLDFVTEIGASVHQLSGSHRCPKPIVDVAERFFERNMFSTGSAEGVLGKVGVAQQSSAIRALEALIKRCDQEKIERSEIAFVCTRNDRIAEIVRALEDAGIPAAEGRVHRDDADWFAAFVETVLLADPPRDVSDIDRLVTGIYGIAERFSQANERIEAMQPAIRGSIVESMSQWETLPDRPLVELLPATCERLAMALQMSRVFLRVEIEEISKEVASARALFEREARSHISKATLLRRLRPEGNVRGYTFQGIKGMEFTGVVLLDCSGPTLPHEYDSNWWDAARLMYVGVTRSKQYLMLHMPTPSEFSPIVDGSRAASDIIKSQPAPWIEKLRGLIEP